MFLHTMSSVQIYIPFPSITTGTFILFHSFFLLCSAVRSLSGTERLERSHMCMYQASVGQSSLEPLLLFYLCVVYVEL
jgi:hypothetical protein